MAEGEVSSVTGRVSEVGESLSEVCQRDMPVCKESFDRVGRGWMDGKWTVKVSRWLSGVVARAAQ